MKNILKILVSFLSIGVLSVGLMAQPAGAARYDGAIQQKVTQKPQNRKQWSNVRSSVEDGIVILTGTVDLYQDKIDAARKIHKTANLQGVRNLIQVAGPSVPDQQLQQKLAEKLYYDRVGYYDAAFDYLTVAVQNGVATVGGETYNEVGRDSALALVQRMPGVKDVVDEIKVSLTSIFDDSLRLRAARAIYGDSALGKYAIDPARPVRIIVNHGNISLYGTVDSLMDKQIAGIRVNSVPGAFSVNNHLVVEDQSNSGM
ncbi:MAG: phospholipid-binding protein [Acidobacteria bacterium]|nr:MAG: phospholipid-binding protein [Acidobacteriota bacterium]